MKAEAGKPLVVDTAKIVGGKFEFKGTAGTPELNYLRLNDRDYFAQFFLENASINVESYKDSLRATKVTGSPTTDIFNTYVEEVTRLNNVITSYSIHYTKLYDTGIETRETVLGYIQRGGSPTPMDRILATRYVAFAADCIANGKRNNFV